jgi:hypothetical protein
MTSREDATNEINFGTIQLNKLYYITFNSIGKLKLNFDSSFRVGETYNEVADLNPETLTFTINIKDKDDNTLEYDKILEKNIYLKKIIIIRRNNSSDPDITNNRYLEINSLKINSDSPIEYQYSNNFDGKIMNETNTKYEFILPGINNFSSNTFNIKVELEDKDKSSGLTTSVDEYGNWFQIGLVFGAEIEIKLDRLYEYNQINEMVKKLMNNRDKLLEQNSKNQTIIRARELIKKKIEFHKYWINILYEIIFYTHLVLVVIVILMLLYKLL